MMKRSKWDANKNLNLKLQEDMEEEMLLGVYGGLNAFWLYGDINAPKCMTALMLFMYFSKVYFCKVYLTCVSSERCKFIVFLHSIVYLQRHLCALFISGHARQIVAGATAGAMADSGYLTCLLPLAIFFSFHRTPSSFSQVVLT